MEWQISDGLTEYEAAVEAMEARVIAIRAGDEDELVWLLEHPSLYTAGTSANDVDLLEPSRLPIYRTGRGGQYTYHGPGQRIAYVLLDLQRRKIDVRRYVSLLEEWLIATLRRFNLLASQRCGRVGIWVDRGNGREDKIAAVGVRIRRWITYHGVAINVEPNLSHFSGIVPCGIKDSGVTSIVDLGLPISMADVDLQLVDAWAEVFGNYAAYPK